MCIKICDCYLYGCWTRYRGITKIKTIFTHFANSLHKLTFCRSFSFRRFFSGSRSPDRLPFSKDPGLICVHWLGWNARVSLELNRENSKTCNWDNKLDPHISRSVGRTRMQRNSCRSIRAVAIPLNNTATSHHWKNETFFENVFETVWEFSLVGLACASSWENWWERSSS